MLETQIDGVSPCGEGGKEAVRVAGRSKDLRRGQAGMAGGEFRHA
jgi:hypothetical protein